MSILQYWLQGVELQGDAKQKIQSAALLDFRGDHLIVARGNHESS